MKFSVAVEADVPAAAARVMFCGAPGVRLSVDGFAVTPAGRPLIATATVPVNELMAVDEMLTWEPTAPGVSVRAVGDMVRLKSGGGATVSVTIVVRVSIPDVPVSINVAVPAAAVVAAVRAMVCAAPGVRVSIDGWALTPAGSPEIATATAPANPFVGDALTLICCAAPPGTRVTVVGAEARLKSLTGSGLEPPPQESNAIVVESPANRRILEMETIMPSGGYKNFTPGVRVPSSCR